MQEIEYELFYIILYLKNKKEKKIMSNIFCPVLWPPHVKSWLIGKDSDAGSDWGQEEKGATQDEMVS